MDVLAVAQPVTLPDVFEGVQFVVAEAQVFHPEVNQRIVASCGEHHVDHYLVYLELLSSWECLLFSFHLARTASSVFQYNKNKLNKFLLAKYCNSKI
jgi:hypothetical protein